MCVAVCLFAHLGNCWCEHVNTCSIPIQRPYMQHVNTCPCIVSIYVNTWQYMLMLINNVNPGLINHGPWFINWGGTPPIVII